MFEDDVLSYTGGQSCKGNAIISSVLGTAPQRGWRIQLRLRRNATVSDGQAPLDDIWIYAPGQAQPFRSLRQLQRSMDEST